MKSIDQEPDRYGKTAEQKAHIAAAFHDMLHGRTPKDKRMIRVVALESFIMHERDRYFLSPDCLELLLKLENYVNNMQEPERL